MIWCDGLKQKAHRGDSVGLGNNLTQKIGKTSKSSTQSSHLPRRQGETTTQANQTTSVAGFGADFGFD
jgi:hypothetical protein